MGDTKTDDELIDEKKALNNDSDVSSGATIDLGAANGIIVDEENDCNEFACLKKEELMKYATDPVWVRIRIVLLVLFGLVWFGMLTAAIVIIVVAPKCPPQPNLDWWQKSVIYHVHPQSFLDSNEDGFGDIAGIHQKIDYLKDTLHITSICIGPMNPTPNFNYGYNINDHNITCPHHYGSVTELENLATALHKKGMKLILDFIPNHTSRKHKWFIDSSQPANVSSSYRDYYIWHPGFKGPDGIQQPPNNWLSVYGGSAWTFHEQRQEFYYHTFSEEEPDLNLRNAAVVAALDASLMLWLSRGVDGFRFIATQYLVESATIAANEPVKVTGLKDDYDSLIHNYTAFQPESYDLIVHWRKLLDDFSNNDGKAKSRYYPRVLIAEVNGTTEQTVTFSEKNADGLPGAHISTNKALVKITAGCEADCVYKLVNNWYKATEVKDVWSSWQLGNVDARRVATRISDDRYLNALNMLLLLLPGTSLVYYGEELGMKDIPIDSVTCYNETVLDNCRLLNRAPMQWSDEQMAGFTKGNSTWLPVNGDYHSVNMQAQLAHGYGISSLNVFSNMSTLRQEPSFQWGKFHSAVLANVFFFVRQAEGFPGYIAAVNLGPAPSTVNFLSGSDELGFSLPEVGTVVANTGHFEGPGRYESFLVKTSVKLTNIHMREGEGIVLRWEPDALA